MGFGAVHSRDVPGFYYDARRGADLSRYTQERENLDMPRKSNSAPTLSQAAANKAEEKWKAAQEKADKSKVADDINAAVKLRGEADKATAAANRERFKNGIESKTTSVIRGIRGMVNNHAKPKTNKYDESDVGKIFVAIRTELDAAEKRFKDSLTSPDTPVSSIFSL